MRGTPSELGLMHSGAVVEGEVFTRMIACIVLSSEYVLKIANSEDETCHFNIGQARNACPCSANDAVFSEIHNVPSHIPISL